VIRSGAGESDRKEVYGRIGRKDKKENSVWGEMKWNYTKYGEDENSPKEYKDSEVGVMIGFDKEMRKDITLGVYTKVNKHDMSQGEEKGEITKGVIGVYGGYEEGNWEIKTMLDGSMGSYDTKRKINIVDERELKSEFKGVGIGWDVEGALKVPLTGIIRLRPYIGFETRVNKYGDIKESGGEGLNWEVKEGSYSRTMTRVGVGIEGEKGTIGFNVGVEYKRLLSGEEAKLDGRMAGQKSDIVGAEEGKEIVGIGVGVSNEVVEDVSVYARGSIYGGKRYENISGNVGVSYRFGVVRKKEKGKREEEKAGEKQQREEEVKLGIDEYKLDEETKGNEEDVNREEGVLYLKGHEYDKVVIEGHKDIKRVEILVK
jgi:outer membrane autotransporter protein